MALPGKYIVGLCARLEPTTNLSNRLNVIGVLRATVSSNTPSMYSETELFDVKLTTTDFHSPTGSVYVNSPKRAPPIPETRRILSESASIEIDGVLDGNEMLTIARLPLIKALFPHPNNVNGYALIGSRSE